MKNTKPIYTIGHRNPDTDSICSAIGYAHLKQAMGENVVPARAGKVNEETKFALNHFHVEQPLLITDLYPRVKDITLDCKTVVRETDSLRHLGEIMRDRQRPRAALFQGTQHAESRRRGRLLPRCDPRH